MSFSMFLRKTVAVSTRRAYCTNVPRCFVPMNLARHVSTVLPIKTLSHNGFTTTPILDSVRALRTSAVHQQHPEKAHDHARLWVIEKMTSALLVFIVPLGLAMPNKIVDCIAAVLITIHSFWGLEAIAVDYVRAAIFGPLIPKVAIALVYAVCISMLAGLFYLISHDVGMFAAIKQLWSVKSASAQNA